MQNNLRKFRPLAGIAALIGKCHAGAQFKKFQGCLSQSRAVQDKLLSQIISANKDSDFGSEHKLESVANYDDLKRAVPLAKYQYFQPYIEKCRQGRVTAMLGSTQKLLMFAMTSGTTAAFKYLPVTTEFANKYRKGWNIWGIKALADHPDIYLRKILQISSSARQEQTESGLPCGSLSGLLAKNQKSIVKHFYSTPLAVTEIEDVESRYYTIARIALCDDIAAITTASPTTTIKLAQTIEQNAQSLIRDIHDGTIAESIKIDDKIFDRIKKKLKPNPKRAAELEKLSAKYGGLLPKHCWNIGLLCNWIGGTMQMYLPRLRQYYRQAPLRDIGLLASEGRVSIPFEDNTAAGVLDISSNFFEFVEEKEIVAIGDNPARATLPDDLNTLRAHELEINKSYFIFLTNFMGLYRYHLGDIVRVVDFVGTTPVIEFLSKGSHISSIAGEKLTEYQAIKAVNILLGKCPLKSSLFTIVPIWAEPPYYRLYLEIEPSQQIDIDLAARIVDDALRSENYEYDIRRKTGRLGPAKISLITDGAISKNDQILAAKQNNSSEHFKHRFLQNAPITKPADIVWAV